MKVVKVGDKVTILGRDNSMSPIKVKTLFQNIKLNKIDEEDIDILYGELKKIEGKYE